MPIEETGSASDFRVTFAQLDPCALISPKEFACLLGITPGAFYQRNMQGEFPRPAMSRNRCVRWRAADVREWLNGLNTIAKRRGRRRRSVEQ
ncbi:AlpA family phage regulatory protein [Caballeronia sp. INDeC2]|uniref:helix-turn-helix transcriptional regulator n=1 Tax=Caballeronia sp. INDeC2 TaxID=2921747 RepID=UPI0020293178|nr:AlpA family phage regulatory protein [Caballeronia sp. INDeC2]